MKGCMFTNLLTIENRVLFKQLKIGRNPRGWPQQLSFTGGIEIEREGWAAQVGRILRNQHSREIHPILKRLPFYPADLRVDDLIWI